MISWFLFTVAIYLILGGLFAVFFVASGVERVDKAARGAPWGFRILIFPGVVALWPVLIVRLLSGSVNPRVERNAHRDAVRESRR